MATQGRKSVNIQMASSANGLKEELSVLARKRAVSISKIVSQIYTFAVDNQDLFPDEIDQPRPKPGAHISTDVSQVVATSLTEWAKRLERSRAHHCCFLLECVINDAKLRARIFVSSH